MRAAVLVHHPTKVRISTRRLEGIGRNRLNVAWNERHLPCRWSLQGEISYATLD
jgi:hypothetical protein